MKFNIWSSEEEQLLLQLLTTDAPIEEMTSTFAVYSLETNSIQARTSEAILRKIRRLRLKRLEEIVEKEINELDSQQEEKDPWNSIREIQKTYIENSIYSQVGISSSPNTRKILVLSDIHFPMARQDHLKAAIELHSDADIVVLNGDILDGYAASTFDKDREIAAIDEYIAAFEFVELLASKFPKVVITSGNHDVRLTRLLKKAPINQGALSTIQTDLLARIANGERLDRKGRLVEKITFNNVYYPQQESWWVQIGKTIFIHPHNRGSSKPGFTVEGWSRKFLERLPRGSFDSIVCGHTHKLYKGIVNSLLLIEQGCMADYMAYAWQPRELLAGNSMNGYAVIYQDAQGNTDYNQSGFVYLGQLLPISKDKLE